MSIIVRNLSYTYQSGSPTATNALEEINLEITEGDFLGLIGHTGSGKSTLVQHLNGLLKPSVGEVIIDDESIFEKGFPLAAIRKKVGLVFQYPEHQLFEDTVLKDVIFGPLNLGFAEKEAIKKAKKALTMVDLDFSRIKDKSPFNLSGGQKRRVAIAGVLAMEPKYLVLDEPTAGLDPVGRDEILKEIKALQKELKMTIVLVSHSMDDVAKLANKIVVMHQGRIAMQGTPKEIFQSFHRLREIGLDVPMITELLYELRGRGLDLRTDLLDIKAAKEEILRALRKERQPDA